MRIQSELQQRGVERATIQLYLIVDDECWGEQAHEVRVRKFGVSSPKEQRERMRQMRYLLMRGYTQGQAYKAMSEDFFE